MKKALILIGTLILITILVIPIIYFYSRSDETKNKPVISEPDPTEEYQKFINDTTITRIFRGILPCSDCDGTETIISLSQKEGKGQSGDFSMVITYLGTDKDAQIVSGSWIIKQEEGEASKLIVLNFSDGSSQFYQWIDDDTLVKLKNDESEYPNEDEYTLKLQ